MRVPIPVVILLVLAVVGGVWWTRTRQIDFLTPPSEARLVEIRVQVESSLPRADQMNDVISVPPVVKPPEPPPVEEPKPFDVGDLTTPPILQQYGELSPLGAAHLTELATELEKKGEFVRALLAWERVLDLASPDAAQAATAVSAIARLRPSLPNWNDKPETALLITLHAGTAKKLTKALTPILEGVARDLEAASSGILKVKTVVTPGKSGTPAKGPTPVALWLAGPDKKSSSTEVLSFTVASPETLRQEVLKNVFLLVRSHLNRATAYTPPAALADGEDPQVALNRRITRLCWSEFAAAMNLPLKIPAKP